MELGSGVRSFVDRAVPEPGGRTVQHHLLRHSPANAGGQPPAEEIRHQLGHRKLRNGSSHPGVSGSARRQAGQ